MPPLSIEQNDQALVQLRSGVSTRKFPALVDISQSYVAHMRRDVGGEIEIQRRGHSMLFAIERRGIVSLLLLKVDLEVHL